MEQSRKVSAKVLIGKIKRCKGQFLLAAWVSYPKPKAEFKDVKLRKESQGVIKAGISFANLTAVKDGIANGERGQVQPLKYGEWENYPYTILYKGVRRFRLYPSNNHKTKITYFVNDEKVSKQKFSTYLTNSESKKMFEKKEPLLCFDVLEENLREPINVTIKSFR